MVGFRPHERSIVVDRIPGIRTSIPSAIDYPMNTKQGMGFGKGLINDNDDDSMVGKGVGNIVFCFAQALVL